MAAVNKATFVKNLFTGSTVPLRMLGIFQAGASQAIKRGEIITIAGGTWIPLGSDASMAGVIAVANEEIKAGDRAGYYEIIVPREGDVFEYALAAAAAVTVTSALYWSDSQTVTTSGNNILGRAVGQEHYPIKQGHLTDDASGDAGSTVRSTSFVRMLFTKAASYWVALNV